MPNPQVQNDPIYQLPFLYVNGLTVSVASDSTLTISAGQCRDSNDIMDIVIGSAPLNGGTTTAPVTLDAATVGANGLDTGTLGNSLVYAVYAIGDSRYYQLPATLLSLASNSVPRMPFGYDSYRLIGYAVTDGTADFLPAYISGTNSNRLFIYDAPIATAVTAGNSNAYASVVLTTFVPPVDNTPVLIQTDYTANAAADILNLQGFDSTGDAVTIIAPVAGATAHTVTVSTVLAQLNTAAPTIKYKVSAGTVAVNVAGFVFNI
jgi:hypothetical protein